MRAVVCDGSNVNTGVRNGIIRIIEESLEKPVQWLVCLLHCNELPFREIFKTLDGGTTGPKHFTGEIGQRLSFDMKNLPIVEFEPISGYAISVSDEARQNLSKD